MKKEIEASGKTREDAVNAGLEELRKFNGNITADDVEIELLEKPKTGFFGIGSVNAKVRLTYTLKPEERAKEFLEGLLERMGIEGTVTAEFKDDILEMNITGENMGVVIGRRGDTLDALQYITSIAVNKGEEEHIRLTIDTENYRMKREESLENLAKKVAARVLKYKRNVTLEPMSSYERRVIHSALQGAKGITTYSTGSEPNRKVVVALAGSGRGRQRAPRPAAQENAAKSAENTEE